MTQKEVYERFKLYLPQYAENIEAGFPNGKNSVRVRLRKPGQQFVFTCNGDQDWCFETVNSFLKRMKGGK